MHTPLNDLTRLAHQLVRPCLPEGGVAVDATAGNGHDTAFLARVVGPEGRVHAWDRQEEAVGETMKKLEQEGLAGQVSLRAARHEQWEELLPEDLRGGIHAVMFNLGFLPGGSKRIRTEAASTLKALQGAVRWLAPGGVISALTYRGHEGGPEEATAVERWAASLPAPDWQTLRCSVPNAPSNAPVLILARQHRKALGP